MLFRSMALMTVLNMAKAAVSLLVSVLVGRHIAPGEYGLVTFSIPLMALVTLLTDLGLSSALVRHPDLPPRTQSRALTFLAWLGLGAGSVLAILARPVERWVNLPGLTPVMLTFGLVTALAIWATGPRALLEREMAYGKVSFIEGLALLMAILAFLVMVAMNAGLAAVLAFHVVLQLVRALGFNLQAWQRYSAPGHLSEMKPLLAIGGWVLATNLLSFLGRNLDRLVIAPVLGASALGLYGMAYQFMTIPLVLISWPASGVLLSALSKMEGAPEQRRRIVAAVITLTALFSGPFVAAMMFAIDEPLHWFFGPRWSGLLDLIVWMAPVGAVQSIAALAGAVLVQSGKVRENFLLGVLNAGSLGVTFVLTVSHGLTSLVMAYSVVAVLVSLAMIQRMCLDLGMGWPQLLKALLPGALAGVGVSLPYAVEAAWPGLGLPWWQLLSGAFVCWLVVTAMQRRAWSGAIRSLNSARVGVRPGGLPTVAAEGGR